MPGEIHSIAGMRCIAIAVALCLLFSASPIGVSAQSTEPATSVAPAANDRPIQWHEEWSDWDYWHTSALGIGFGTTALFYALHANDSGWVNPPSFDATVRDEIGSREPKVRQRLADVSDILVGALVTWPLFVDPFVSAWWYHGEPELAQEMALTSLLVLSTTAGIQATVSWAVGRQRPYVRDCGSDVLDAADDSCQSDQQNRSFFSGHSAQSFAAAASTCVMHAKLPLYGEASDILPCVMTELAAMTTALLRVLAKMHYLSDVLTGMAVGTAVGITIPMLRMNGESSPASIPGINFAILPTPTGVQIVGEF